MAHHRWPTDMTDAIGPDWYCPYCDKFVPHVDTTSRGPVQRHQECGKPVQPNKFDRTQAPREWSE